MITLSQIAAKDIFFQRNSFFKGLSPFSLSKSPFISNYEESEIFVV